MNAIDLNSFFKPQQIAIIGASSSPGKIGYTVLSNLLQAGFQGKIFPVNPKAEAILDLPVTNRIQDLPEKLDMAVLTIPRDLVLPSLQELAEKQVRSVVIITAGFKEVGREGYHLEQEIVELAEANGIALLGPNCLGLINTSSKLNVTFAAGTPPAGNIAFFSQSGALCQAILDWAVGENIGFSSFVSLGNKAVLNEGDMLRHLGSDPETDVILGYIENVSNGQQFLDSAQAMSHKKPVLLIKSGTSAAGAKAASSHTGAIAGSDQAYDAAFEQSGIIRVKDVSTLFTLAQAFSSQPLPQGPNLAIVTNSGGPGIMTADACEGSHLNIAKLNESTIQRMREFLPSFASLYNPVDIIGDADAERYLKTIEVVLEDSNVDSLLILLTPTGSVIDQIPDLSERIAKLTKGAGKPVFVCYMGKQAVAEGQKILQQARIPCYNFPEPAIQSLEAMYRYQLWQNRTAEPIERFEVDQQAVRQLIQEVQSSTSQSGGIEIVEYQAQKILDAYRLPTPRTELAQTSDHAVRAAEAIGYPIVLKIASADISHKSDVGGVAVNLTSPEQVKKTFIEMTSRAKTMRPEAYITGCLVQEMAPKGVKEIIVGFKRDDQFGPLLMFGLGGIYVEVLKDIAFKLAPVSRNEARQMVRDIRSYMLLKGVRGEAGVDIESIVDIILRMSQFAVDFPEVSEAEFNPVLVNEEQAIVADVRMMLG